MGAMKELYIDMMNERMGDAPDHIQDWDDYEYWHYLKSYVPNEPAERYRHTVERLDEIADASKLLGDYPMFHRMMLVQHVAMIEAYLADRLIILATRFESVRKRIVLNHQKLKEQKFSLEAFVGSPDLVSQQVTVYLRNVMYHELELVSDIYRAGLQFEIFPDEAAKAVMKDAMVKRHHCVHRDGKDNEGKILEVDADYVKKAKEHFVGLVEHIERECSELTAIILEEHPF